MHGPLDAADIAGSVVNNGNHFRCRSGLELSIGGWNGIVRQPRVKLNSHTQGSGKGLKKGLTLVMRVGAAKVV